jgi:hypothetical protein
MVKTALAEKEQDQIIYENICMQLCTGDFSRYKVGSVGNIVQWLRALGLIHYDITQIGWNSTLNQGEVTLWGDIIATYMIDNKYNIPVFTFIDKYKWLQFKQTTYIESIEKYPNPFEKWMK